MRIKLKYFEVARLWALGVGSVIGGDFFGWESALEGGFGAAVLALCISTLLYGILGHCISELSIRMPKSGGSYMFVSSGMGSKAGFIVAGLELLKLFWVIATLGFGLAGYFRAVLRFSSELQFLFYAALFFVFVMMGMSGLRTSGNTQLVVTTCCIAVLVFYWISVLTRFDFVSHAVENSVWFHSWRSTLHSIPYGCWCFLGFEELPLLVPQDTSELNDTEVCRAPTESFLGISKQSSGVQMCDNSKRNSVLSWGLSLSFLTVTTSGSLTLFLASSSPPGAEVVADEEAPLFAGMERVYGENSWVVNMFGVLSVLALMAPFYSFILYGAHHLQEVATEGLLPEWVKSTSKSGTPVNGLKAVGIIGLLLMTGFGLLFGTENSSVVLIPGCLLPTLISYLLQLQSLANILSSAHSEQDRRVESATGVTLWEIRLGQILVIILLLCVLVLGVSSQGQWIGMIIVSAAAVGVFCLMGHVKSDQRKSRTTIIEGSFVESNMLHINSHE